MEMLSLYGNPRNIGFEYGRVLAEKIDQNLQALIWEAPKPLPTQDPDFLGYVSSQEAILGANWPWLLEEIAAVAEGAGVEYRDVLLLNLRAWQYEFYGKPADACSSLAITLADGSVAFAGALDDPVEYYCGPVRVSPTYGHRYVTFPITGTSWGNLGMNSAGLTVGISSQILPGLRRLKGAIGQDLAVRVVLQTCSSVDEVREFCLAHPFTMNLVCVDAHGGIFCAQQTAGGLLEVRIDGYAALTNHILDEHRFRMIEWGVKEFPESATTRPRRENLLRFGRERSGRCSFEEVRESVSSRDDNYPGSIHNSATAYLAIAEPQKYPGRFHVMKVKKPKAEFETLDI